MLKTKIKEWAIPILLSREGHVNIIFLSLSKQVITLEGQHMAKGEIPGWLKVL